MKRRPFSALRRGLSRQRPSGRRGADFGAGAALRDLAPPRRADSPGAQGRQGQAVLRPASGRHRDAAADATAILSPSTSPPTSATRRCRCCRLDVRRPADDRGRDGAAANGDESTMRRPAALLVPRCFPYRRGVAPDHHLWFRRRPLHEDGVDRYGLAAQEADALVDLPKFIGDQLQPARTGGDISSGLRRRPADRVPCCSRLERLGYDVAQLRWA